MLFNKNMKPTTLKERLGLDEDMELMEAEGMETEGMSDEDLKIESLKIATNIGKLMSNVTTEDIVSIAETVAKFIKGSESLTLDNTDETESNEEATADTEEDFSTEEQSEEEKESEKESTQTEEDFEV